MYQGLALAQAFMYQAFVLFRVFGIYTETIDQGRPLRFDRPIYFCFDWAQAIAVDVRVQFSVYYLLMFIIDTLYFVFGQGIQYLDLIFDWIVVCFDCSGIQQL